jgi:hypothetical protein
MIIMSPNPTLNNKSPKSRYLVIHVRTIPWVKQKPPALTSPNHFLCRKNGRIDVRNSDRWPSACGAGIP